MTGILTSSWYVTDKEIEGQTAELVFHDHTACLSPAKNEILLIELQTALTATNSFFPSFVQCVSCNGLHTMKFTRIPVSFSRKSKGAFGKIM